MGERKGTNKYYPPDFDPGKGSLNAYHGTHALRERARKIHEGIIIIRFEMPYNIWCNGCGIHIGMGVRYNAQKRKVGNYYTTPIYKFRMKCHLCDQHFEIQTDPKNCDYVILSGARRKEERWDPAVTENIQTTDRDVKAKLISDAMFKLEHSIEDKQKAKRAAPTINQIRHLRDEWSDDYAINQLLRKKFRDEKKEIGKQKELDDKFKERMLLPSSMELAKETEEDASLAKRMRYGEDLRPDVKRKKRMQAIKRSTIFEKQVDSKEQLAMHLAGLAARRSSTNVKRMPNSFEKTLTNVVIGRKGGAMKERIPATHVNDSNKNKDSVEEHVRLDATESFGEQSKKGEPGHSNITKSFDLANDTIAEKSNIIEDQEEVKGPTITDGQCLALGQFVMKDGNSQEAEGSNNEITSASEIPFQLSYNKAKLNSSLVAEYGTSSDDE